MLAGYEPLQIVPAVLLSELLTGLAAGAMHHRDGNIDLRQDPAARRTFGLLALLSALGAIVAVMLAVKISAQWFSLLIAVIVLAMGLITPAHRPPADPLSPWRHPYHRPGRGLQQGPQRRRLRPLVTSRSGGFRVPARQAVAITSMAEALTCAVGLGALPLLQEWHRLVPHPCPWWLAPCSPCPWPPPRSGICRRRVSAAGSASSP